MKSVAPVSRHWSVVKILLGIIFLYSCCTDGGYKEKTLTLCFPDSTGKKTVTLYYSVEGLKNYLYETYMAEYDTVCDRLSVTIPDSIRSFNIKIQCENPTFKWFNLTNSVNFFMSEGNHISNGLFRFTIV